MRTWGRWGAGWAAGVVLGLGVSSLSAAPFPERPVRILVGSAAGGSTDALARSIGAKLARKWGQPVVVDNRTGGGATIANGVVAHAAPDGHTIAIVTTALTITPNQIKLNYDPVKSFAPISLLAVQPNVLVTNPSVLPVNSLAELIALARSKPGQIKFGNGGFGGPPFMDMAQLMHRTGINLISVPYKGGSLALVGLLGGEVQMIFQPAFISVGQVKAGKLKALAVSSNVRISLMPEIPTVAEAANLPDFNGGTWYGALAPARTPRHVVDKLHGDIVEAMKSPDVQQPLADQGFVTTASTPGEFAAIIAKDMAKWPPLFREFGGAAP